jgi:hypothetical protein
VAPAGLLRWAALAAVGAATFLGVAPALADTASPLPKGYANDERLPTLPANDDKGGGWVVGDKQEQPAQATPPPSDPSADQFADTDPSALDDFQQPLAPYGQWVEDGTYGTVWVPDSGVVGSDFAPYQTAGHWSLTEDEQWYWASDYSWGYIPFHYGRWVWISGHGWSWIPGRTYAPAWVTWRVGEYGYIGWAPMPPSWYWWGGVAVSLWAIPPAPFCFVPTAYVFHDHVTTYIVHDRQVMANAASHTRPYTPASPAGHTPAQPHAGGGAPAGPNGASSHGGHAPASPSVKDAHVPSNAVPQSRVQPDRRAAALARPSTSPTHSVGSSLGASRRAFSGTPGSSPGRGFPSHTLGAGPSRGMEGPAARPQPFAGDPGARSFSPRPPASTFHPSSPSFHGTPASPPAFHSAPSTPSFHSAPSAPSFHSAPSAPSFRPSMPSVHSTPSVRPSAPSFRPSAPSGGFRGGSHRR